MNKIQHIINVLFLSCVLTPLTLFIFPVVYAVADGAKGASYFYEFGGPLQWLMVSDDAGDKNGVIDAVFNGNTGITIYWISLLCSFLMVFVVAYLVMLIIRKKYSESKRK